MKKNFDIIINVLIILLIIALITVMMSYYMGSLDVPTNDNVETNNSVENTKNNDEKQKNEQIILINSGDTQVKEENNINKNPNIIENEEIVSGDVNSEDLQSGDIKNDEAKNETNNTITSPVIITSENDISSKEKKEILTELDNTLMELLEVVDKVQTVDESRLIMDDGEVQQ